MEVTLSKCKLASGLCESTFSEKGKHCPSKSRCTTYKFNAGLSPTDLKKCMISEKMCESRNCTSYNQL